MDKLLSALRAAGEPTRLRLLALLQGYELVVTEISSVLGQSQPRVSRHLKLLCEAGLLERFQEGAWVFYRMSDRHDAGVIAHAIAALLPSDDPDLRRDQERLNAIKRKRAESATRYFADIAERWDELRQLYVEESAVERAVLKACGQSQIGDLLDIGTGTGRMLELLAPRTERGLGIDLSREMLSVARSNLEASGIKHCRVRHGDVYQLGLSDHCVDLITVHQVLHFLEQPAEAIAEAARVLRPGGRLVLVDFAPHNLEFLRAAHAHRRLGFDDTDIATWCEQAGLADVSAQRLPASRAASDQSLTTVVWTAREQSYTHKPREQEAA